jgi:hypothetical protein
MTKSLGSDFHPPTEFVNRLLGVCVVDRVPGGPMRLSKWPGLFRNKEIWFGPDPQAQRSVLYYCNRHVSFTCTLCTRPHPLTRAALPWRR